MNQTKEASAQLLGTAPIGKLLVQYSIPAIIASVATSVYNIVDSIFIGQGVGPMAIAGLAITFPLMNLVIGFCTLVAVGACTISSIFLGQKNVERATETVNIAMVLCLAHALVFGGLTYIFLDPILRLFGATDATISYASEFTKVILIGTPISYVFLGLNNIMRATGYPRKAMMSALLSVGVNIILAPIFIYKLHWGIAGAAGATIIGQTVAFIWVLHHFFSKKSFVHFNFKAGFWNLDVVKRIYSIGLSPFLMNATACFVVVFLNKSLLSVAGNLGDIAVGAYGILNRTTMFFVMIVFGVTQGMQPILGYNFGARNWARVKRTLYKGIWLGFGITAVGWILTQTIPDQISALFTKDAQMIDIARRAYHIYFIIYPVVGVQIVIQNYFQSIGKPLWSIFLSLTRQLLYLVPLLYFLPKILGIDGVWYSMVDSDGLAFITAIIVLIFSTRHHNKEFKNNDTTPAIAPKA
ncbi:MAG: MATE family efflux transporter [Bacteroidales bacterium]|nr:MATE family efflux transporter [Bacteroidales bacterium]